MAVSQTPLLEVRGLSKQFPGVRALDRVGMEVRTGEVVAVIGENGAGKSTLMKILAGIERPDAGTVRLEGRPVQMDSPLKALELGIALIHQELNLADNLDVGANIFLGREPRRYGLIDKPRIAREARSVLDQIGLRVSPQTLLAGLPIGQQQMVEIAKALSVHARILIMDEPTSSLSQRETEALFRVVKDLQHRQVSVIYISHRLGEVNELADRVVVLRDGKNAGELARDEIEHDRMVRLMIGRDVAQFYVRRAHHAGEPMLEVENLVVPAHPEHRVTFCVRSGEIVGVAGLVGAGRTELLRVLFGVDRPLGGTIRVGGRPMQFQNPVDAIGAGVALVPEDRSHQGLILEMAIRQNVSLAGLRRHRHAGGWLNRKREQEDASAMIRALDIRTPSANQIVEVLSGGNQQKVVLGKWLSLEPRVLLLDEPTRGIDVGAKEEIYRLMEQLAEQGVAILFASSEMEEILEMSDRVLVIHEGRLAGELGREQLGEEAVMQLATGAGAAAAGESSRLRTRESRAR